MSTTRAGSQAAHAARRPPANGGAVRPGCRPPASGGAVRPARWTRARGRGRQRRAAWLAVVAAGIVLLAAACGGSPGPAASPGQSLYQRSLTYSRCMRSHGVPDFPILKQGPGGTLAPPLSPPAGMLTAPGYDTAFRACLKLAVTSGHHAARYRAMALQGLQQAECMRAHGITNYPSPATLDGGIHGPDPVAIGLDTHTLQFQAAAKACGMAAGLWQQMWWWPATMSQPGGSPAGMSQP
jgi:hypothetical protein